MQLRQLFDKETSTFTYLLFDEASCYSVIIDPVIEQFERDLRLIKELDLKLLYTLETHIHADHISGSYEIAKETGAKIGVSGKAQAQGVDLNLSEGETLNFGQNTLHVRETPGHTETCLSFIVDGMVFTGDALMIRKCGRTDFQGGNARTLYKSVHEKLFTLPGETTIYPGHDYGGLSSSTIEEERQHNLRLNNEISQDEFIEIMENLNLPYPNKMDVAVPANLRCGRCEEKRA